MGIVQDRMAAKAKREAEAKGLTFAEQPGSPAIVQAKELAQAKSRKKVTTFPTFYTRKGDKVLKLQVKPGKTVSVYIGSMKKHRDALNISIAQWKKAGDWIEEHAAKEKCAEILATFEKG